MVQVIETSGEGQVWKRIKGIGNDVSGKPLDLEILAKMPDAPPPRLTFSDIVVSMATKIFNLLRPPR